MADPQAALVTLNLLLFVPPPADLIGVEPSSPGKWLLAFVPLLFLVAEARRVVVRVHRRAVGIAASRQPEARLTARAA